MANHKHISQTAIAGLLFLLVIECFPAIAQGNHAYIFIDHNLRSYSERIPVHLRVYTTEFAELKAAGYTVSIYYGSYKEISETVLQSIIYGQPRALSYFGHTSVGVTLGTSGANTWRSRIYQLLFEHYLRQGMSDVDADRWAKIKSTNFGFDLVKNHSCYSLEDDSIARLFVRPGGVYFGSRGPYAPIPIWEMVLTGQLILNAYTVKGDMPSWGSAGPIELGLQRTLWVVHLYYGGGIDGYRDQINGRIWFWTNNWTTYLVETDEGFLSFHKDEPNIPTHRYQRDRDPITGRLTEMRDEKGKLRWFGSLHELLQSKYPQRKEPGRWYAVWD